MFLESWGRDGDYLLVPMCSRKRGTLSMRSGTAVGQGSPCERQCDQLHILLRSRLHRAEVGRRMDHVLQFGDKEIEVWRGTHHEFSMWEEDVDSTRGEIVPEQFQKGRDVWAQVS